MPLCEKTRIDPSITVIAILLCWGFSPALAEDHPNAEQFAVTKPYPPYPTQAIQAHEQGTVVLQVKVENGKPVGVSVITGPPTLAAASVRWVKANWKFKSGTTGVFDLPIRFRYEPGGGIDSEFLYRPAPPYPAAARKKNEEGDVLLLIKVKEGVVTDVVPKSGPDDLASPAASWIKEKWKFKADLTKNYTLPIFFRNPSGKPIKPKAVVRIVVKNGVIVEITPVSGSPKATAAAIDFVKKNWEFSPEQSGTFTLPIVVEHTIAK
ncbi:MAG: energy transducer TonB [Verrucomicrobia bacterium]|nr:energy transducer TonB [Verrucomicrobiota bacterium]MBV8275360.1 energy transducer TonB [Verrucomicrobiota bacterium]